MFFFGAIGPAELLIILFILSPVFAWVVALVDIVRSEFTDSNKIVWVLIVLFIPLVGAILYFFIGRKQKIKLPQ